MKELELLLPEVSTEGSLPTMQLPDADQYNYWNLYNNHILTVDGEITDWDYNVVKNIIGINMQQINKPTEWVDPIILLINSHGGLLDVTNSIIDAISTSIVPVWTVNMGNALSGGCLIFLAGEKRFTTTNSWAMAHAGSGGVSGNYNETVEQTKVWNEQVKNMGNYIVSRTGIDDKTWKKYKNKDWWLNADQQIEYGFATDKLESLKQILRVER